MKTCQWLNTSLFFFPIEILPCCVLGERENLAYANPERREHVNMDFKERKKQLNDILNNEEIIKKYKCFDCMYRVEQDAKAEDKKINLIGFHHWRACNCGCIYCFEKDDKNHFLPVYSPYKILQQLYQDSLIDSENLRVWFQGGDIAVLKDFDKYIDLFEQNGFMKIDFSTNNIKYMPKIESILKANKGSLCVSLDCGTAETYRKIKCVNKFDKVVKNLEKYIKNVRNDNLITVNYIILDGINDNEEEISKFMDLMYQIGVKRVALRLEHKHVAEWSHTEKIEYCSPNLDKIIIHFFKTARKYNMFINMDCKEQNQCIIKIFRYFANR